MSDSDFPLSRYGAKMEITTELGQQLGLYILLNVYHAERQVSHRTGLKKYIFFKVICLCVLCCVSRLLHSVTSFVYFTCFLSEKHDSTQLVTA